MSDEEKARAIWAAAAIKGAHPLDEPAAKKLGNKLASAAHLYRVALEFRRERRSALHRLSGRQENSRGYSMKAWKRAEDWMSYGPRVRRAWDYDMLALASD